MSTTAFIGWAILALVSAPVVFALNVAAKLNWHTWREQAAWRRARRALEGMEDMAADDEAIRAARRHMEAVARALEAAARHGDERREIEARWGL